MIKRMLLLSFALAGVIAVAAHPARGQQKCCDWNSPVYQVNCQSGSCSQTIYILTCQSAAPCGAWFFGQYEACCGQNWSTYTNSSEQCCIVAPVAELYSFPRYADGEAPLAYVKDCAGKYTLIKLI
jgi:hypothetical protein